ncbi:hypothetical protein CesoFtcFv8_008064 [Champsocephalus esox]|uniref:Uncharacterized protein n=1 Tax=Champsocephalus esox TaxID=159716 RepID=A0AAN8CFM5_9TELE|nr:hypothetical protein CesoFtcFv8_008064 [Champsocephalus esox]
MRATFYHKMMWSEEPGGSRATAGEEVEQVSSYLSRCALTTTCMSEAARLDMLTVHAMGWNRTPSIRHFPQDK